MKKTIFLLILIGLVGILPLSACVPAQSQPQYYSPKPNAQYVSPGATIIVRYGLTLTGDDLAGLTFSVQGSQSGAHSGKTILADDQKTVIFKPDQPFTAGEKVTLKVGSLQVSAGSFDSLAYSFTISIKQTSGSPAASVPPPPSQPPASAFPDYLTLPKDIPHYTVTQAAPEDSQGYIFVAPFYWMKSAVGSYMLILDHTGQIVYYQSEAADYSAFDFKVQPNGLLSYYSFKDNAFYLMNSHYQVVDKYTAGDGYQADVHDLQILPNGNALLMIYDAQEVDMSTLASGGQKNATVTGLVIQEIDPSKNVVFEWRSWDYFPITDAPIDLTGDKIDAVHGNSLQLMNDGNLLLSSRTLSEVTKISLQTGDVLWHLGGKQNNFKFVDDPQPFGYQHDARQLPNGNIMVFDNHGNADVNSPAPSRSVEYRLDEANKTASKVWEFAPSPQIFATYMGNGQRLQNGNTLIDWGAPFIGAGYAFTNITEVTPSGQPVFQLAFDQPYVSYRAFRFPWQGKPTTPPALAFKTDASGITLGYSWNGATNVASYRLYAGSSQDDLHQIDQKVKDSFETQSHLANLPPNECYFQVAAWDKSNHELARSKVISSDPVRCPLQPT